MNRGKHSLLPQRSKWKGTIQTFKHSSTHTSPSIAINYLVKMFSCLHFQVALVRANESARFNSKSDICPVRVWPELNCECADGCGSDGDGGHEPSTLLSERDDRPNWMCTQNNNNHDNERTDKRNRTSKSMNPFHPPPNTAGFIQLEESSRNQEEEIKLKNTSPKRYQLRL